MAYIQCECSVETGFSVWHRNTSNIKYLCLWWKKEVIFAINVCRGMVLLYKQLRLSCWAHVMLLDPLYRREIHVHYMLWYLIYIKLIYNWSCICGTRQLGFVHIAEKSDRIFLWEISIVFYMCDRYAWSLPIKNILSHIYKNLMISYKWYTECIPHRCEKGWVPHWYYVSHTGVRKAGITLVLCTHTCVQCNWYNVLSWNPGLGLDSIFYSIYLQYILKDLFTACILYDHANLLANLGLHMLLSNSFLVKLFNSLYLIFLCI